jgi:hypothetical protein
MGAPTLFNINISSIYRYRLHITLATLAIGLQLIDYLSTVKLLSLGGYGEAGPVMSHVTGDPWLFAVVKFGLTALALSLAAVIAVVSANRLKGWASRLQYVPYSALIGFGALASANNIRFMGAI